MSDDDEDYDYDDGWDDGYTEGYQDANDGLRFLREDFGDVIEALETHPDDPAMVRRCVVRLKKALEGQLDGE